MNWWILAAVVLVSNVSTFLLARATCRVVMAEPVPKPELPEPPPPSDHLGIGTRGSAVLFSLWKANVYVGSFSCDRDYARAITSEILAICDVLDVSAPRRKAKDEDRPGAGPEDFDSCAGAE